MRPVPIDDADVWEGGVRKVIAAPKGHDLTGPIRPVEAILDQSGDGVIRACMKLVLEEGELEKLVAGGHVWLAMRGHVVPFTVDVKGPRE